MAWTNEKFEIGLPSHFSVAFVTLPSLDVIYGNMYFDMDTV